MPFWNKIKDWLSGSDKKKTLPVKPPSDEIRSAFTRDFFSILFKNKDKHITTMLNSISLSSDMKTLYLIDNGRAIAYDLTAPEGVLVGLLGKQLMAATASGPPPPIEVEDLPEGDGKRTARAEKFIFKAGENSQFTLTYNEGHQTLGIIGWDDFVFNLEAPDENTCKEQRFEMKGNKVVRLLYRKEVLEILNEII